MSSSPAAITPEAATLNAAIPHRLCHLLQFTSNLAFGMNIKNSVSSILDTRPWLRDYKARWAAISTRTTVSTGFRSRVDATPLLFQLYVRTARLSGKTLTLQIASTIPHMLYRRQVEVLHFAPGMMLSLLAVRVLRASPWSGFLNTSKCRRRGRGRQSASYGLQTFPCELGSTAPLPGNGVYLFT